MYQTCITATLLQASETFSNWDMLKIFVPRLRHECTVHFPLIYHRMNATPPALSFFFYIHPQKKRKKRMNTVAVAVLACGQLGNRDAERRFICGNMLKRRLSWSRAALTEYATIILTVLRQFFFLSRDRFKKKKYKFISHITPFSFFLIIPFNSQGDAYLNQEHCSLSLTCCPVSPKVLQWLGN